MRFRVYFMSENRYVTHVATFAEEDAAEFYNPPKYNRQIKVIRYVY
jgi:hypothetical protein